jgi:hypothetical protein
MTRSKFAQILWKAAYDEAWEAGMQAGRDATPTPMVVRQHANQFDDGSAVVQSWHVPDGVCGFAWVVIRPARGPFITWCRANGVGRLDSYAGGWSIWIDEHGQSMTRKIAHAQTMAEKLRGFGVAAYSQSRMD